jgi:hypothetical protein
MNDSVWDADVDKTTALTTAYQSLSITKKTPTDPTLTAINNRLMESLGFQLDYASVNFQGLFLPFEQISSERTISLEPFRELFNDANAGQTFFPRDGLLFVRDDMKRIMNRFLLSPAELQGSSIETPNKFVLMGSPGTGKSLLFFLAAVLKVSKKNDRIVYLRKSGDELISIFYMFREGHDKIGIYFKRFTYIDYLLNGRLPLNIQALASPLALALYEDRRFKNDPLWFIDGPKHDDKENVVRHIFHYLCTSGGFPSVKNEGVGSLLIWALDAWSEEDMEYAFNLLHNERTPAPFQEIYDLCGGCMRDFMRSMAGSKRLVETTLQKAVTDLDDNEAKLVQYGVESTNAKYNRLRMIFVVNKAPELVDDDANVIHMADSKFVIKLLNEITELKELRKGYEYAVTKLTGSAAGIYFEEYWHKWFSKGNVKEIDVIYGEGDHKASIETLKEKKKYWYPESPTFPHIDAVLVLDTTLYGFQYTVQKAKTRPPIVVEEFMENVLNPVRTTIKDINEVCILYVVPPESKETFQLPEVDRRARLHYNLAWTNVLVIANVSAGMIPDFPFLRNQPQVKFPFLRIRNTNKTKVERLGSGDSVSENTRSRKLATRVVAMHERRKMSSKESSEQDNQAPTTAP